MIPADMPMGSFPEGPNFSITNNPELGNFFPPNSNPMDKFKFVKFPTIFPLTYGSTAIKGDLTNNSIEDALRLISKTTGRSGSSSSRSGQNSLQILSPTTPQLLLLYHHSNLTTLGISGHHPKPRPRWRQGRESESYQYDHDSTHCPTIPKFNQPHDIIHSSCLNAGQPISPDIRLSD